MAEFIIMFREVLEASLIIGILYTFLVQSDNRSYLKKLWQGVYLAIFASILFSFIFQIFANGFEGSSAKIFEGITMIIASFVLATMILWMAQNLNIREQLEDGASKALGSENAGLGIFALSFIAVFREGVEIILFMYGIMFQSDGISVIRTLLGSLMGAGVGYLIFVQGKRMPLKSFFKITSTLLIFVCAGMFTYGVHELESGGLIPYMTGSTEVIDESIVATRLNGESKTFDLYLDSKESSTEQLESRKTNKKKAAKWASRLWDINPSATKHMQYMSRKECPFYWDDSKSVCTEYPLMHDKGNIGSLFKGFFGYNGDPSLIELLAYIFSLITLFYFWSISSRKINK